MSYTHFTLEERKYLQEALAEGKSMRKIADDLGRSPSSVCREIHRNKSKHNKKGNVNYYRYHHWRANTVAIMRRRTSKPKSAIRQGSDLWNYVIDKLQHFWSPEQISAKWRSQHPDATIGFSTIYRYLKAKLFPIVSCKKNLRRKGKRKQTRNANYNTIHPDRLVLDWPKEIVDRLRSGDWEGDTVYGGIGKGLIVTLVDRKTRFLVAGLLPAREASATRNVVSSLLQELPVHSITFDNGAEFAEFRGVEEDLKTLV